MNTPTPQPSPIVQPAATPNLTKAHLRGADKQQNRNVGHFLKSASLHRSSPVRSLPHSRGR